MMFPPHTVDALGAVPETGTIPWCWCNPTVYFVRDLDGEPHTVTVHADQTFGWMTAVRDRSGKPPA